MPGNHEVRWDPTAKGLYREHFGAVPHSFDAGGVHFTGFDPTQPLLEPGHCGAAGLEWLARDLGAAAGPRRSCSSTSRSAASMTTWTTRPRCSS